LEALEDLLKDQGKLKSKSRFREALTTALEHKEALGGMKRLVDDP